MCESVYKWRLCIRLGMDNWSHPSGTFTMLGDAVHATLPYLASGYVLSIPLPLSLFITSPKPNLSPFHVLLTSIASAGMSLEDGAVLGECLSRLPTKSRSRSRSHLLHALQVYQTCRKARTEAVVERGNLQQCLYHLPDGAEQRHRDARMRMRPTEEGEALSVCLELLSSPLQLLYYLNTD